MKEILSYPLQDEKRIQNIVIGGLLILLSPLILPSVFLLGYQLKAMKKGLRGDRSLPDFLAWRDLFTTGLIGIVIGLAYLFFALAFWVLNSVLPGSLGGLAEGLGIVASLVALYLLPSSAAHYLEEGNLRAAFDLNAVLAVANELGYLVTYLKALLVGFVGGIIANLLTVVFVGFFLQFYVNVVVFYLLGDGIARARESVIKRSADPPGTPSDHTGLQPGPGGEGFGE